MNNELFRYELVEDQDAFARLENEWEGLCQALCGSVSVFASFMWYKNWWQFYGGGARLSIFLMREGDRLVGIAPLMWRKESLCGMPVRRIGFMQNNQSLHNDFIVKPELRAFFLKKMIQALFEHSDQWDELYFRNLPVSENSLALAEVLNVEGKSWKQSPNPINSPFLIPAGDWQGFLAGRSRRSRKALNNIKNRISKAGKVSIAHISTWEEFLSCKDALFDLAQQSWTEKISDSLGSPNNRNFFESLAFHAAAKGWLSVWALYLDGRMIAAEFHLRAFGREHALRGHYHPGFASLSPGTYLEMAILQHIFEEPAKVEVYDFCGSFEQYKKKWAETYVSHCDMYVFKDQIYSKLVRFHEETVEPRLKIILHYAKVLRNLKGKAGEKREKNLF